MRSAALLFTILLAAPATAQRIEPIGVSLQPSAESREPRAEHHGRLWASIPLSATFGAAAGAAALIGGYWLFGCVDEGPECTRGPDNAEWIAGAMGMTLGLAIGAHLGGRRAESTGRFGPTLLAAALSTAVGIAGGGYPLMLAPLATSIVDDRLRKPRPRG